MTLNREAVINSAHVICPQSPFPHARLIGLAPFPSAPRIASRDARHDQFQKMQAELQKGPVMVSGSITRWAADGRNFTARVPARAPLIWRR